MRVLLAGIYDGLGDRHLENIMVTQQGLLAHVDFGYVLGDDPKHVSSPMRITEDMIDAMGGIPDVCFIYSKTQRGYEAMRFHASFGIICKFFDALYLEIKVDRGEEFETMFWTDLFQANGRRSFCNSNCG